MGNKPNIQNEKLTPAQHIRNDWRAFLDKLSYRAIVTNIPYLAFVALLCMLYISNNHKAIEMQRELNKQIKILKELNWKYLDVKSRLMNEQMESKVIVKASGIGLQPLQMPPYRINADSNTIR